MEKNIEELRLYYIAKFDTFIRQNNHINNARFEAFKERLNL